MTFSGKLNIMYNSGLKSFVKMSGAFFLICSVGTFLVACLYMIYSACTVLIAGDALDIFSKGFFIKGFVSTLPVCIAISNILLALFLIRHPSDNILPLITYIFIGLLSWLVLLPLTNKLNLFVEEKFSDAQSVHSVSEKYFRKQDDKIIYFTSINESSADGVVIDLNAHDNGVYSFTDTPFLKTESDFSDSLIEETVSVPGYSKIFIRHALLLIRVGQDFLAKGYIAWLWFASFGLALISLLGLRRLSSWRLINVFLILFFAIVLFEFNASYYCELEFQKRILFMEQWFFKFYFIPNPSAFFINILSSIIFTAVGIICHLIRTPRKPKTARSKKIKNAKPKKVKAPKVPKAPKTAKPRKAARASNVSVQMQPVQADTSFDNSFDPDFGTDFDTGDFV